MGEVDAKIREVAAVDPREAAGLVRATYADMLQRFLLSTLPPEACADVAEEVWAGVVTGIARFRGMNEEGQAASVSTWLISIAKRKVADFFERRKREGLVETLSRLLEAEGMVPSALRTPSEEGPSRKAAAEQARQHAQELASQLLDELTPADRLLVEWRYLDDTMPSTWLVRMEQEGCAALLGVEEDFAAYRASTDPERSARGAKLVNLLTQRVGRALQQMSKAARRLKNPARDGAGG